LDIRDARQLRRYQTAAETELFAERDACRFLNQQRVGAAVDREAADVFAEDHAAGARRAFEDDERETAPMELVRGREPRDAAADDRHIKHAVQALSRAQGSGIGDSGLVRSRLSR